MFLPRRFLLWPWVELQIAEYCTRDADHYGAGVDQKANCIKVGIINWSHQACSCSCVTMLSVAASICSYLLLTSSNWLLTSSCWLIIRSGWWQPIYMGLSLEGVPKGACCWNKLTSCWLCCFWATLQKFVLQSVCILKQWNGPLLRSSWDCLWYSIETYCFCVSG